MRLAPALLLLLFAAAGRLAAQTPLVTGRPASGTVARTDTARFTLQADSGFIVRVRAVQSPGNVALRLMGPKHTVVGAVNATRTG